MTLNDLKCACFVLFISELHLLLDKSLAGAGGRTSPCAHAIDLLISESITHKLIGFCTTYQ